MTTTDVINPLKAKLDLTKPVIWLFAVCLIALIVLPLSWLAVFSFTDKARHVTLQNFVTLFTDPDFLDAVGSRHRWDGWCRAPTCRGDSSSAPSSRLRS
jgi:ABC-type glycerol-3-phosphate transport system permease component